MRFFSYLYYINKKIGIMKKEIKNFKVELSGSLIMISKDDITIKAYEVPALHAVDRYKKACESVEKYVLKSSLATS